MKYLGIPFDWPLDINLIRGHSERNTFGMVRSKGDGSPKAHQGWDFFAPAGTPVFAVASGRIIFSGSNGDYGQVIVQEIAGLPGVYASYAHLSERFVKVGNLVHLGQPIAKTGISGNAYNMIGRDQHLHFEMRTTPFPGLGLTGRFSPLKVFKVCPLDEPVHRENVRGVI
jgi:murein DD-endopeptidase MepM/ murein hydrolase activator NlpD